MKLKMGLFDLRIMNMTDERRESMTKEWSRERAEAVIGTLAIVVVDYNGDDRSYLRENRDDMANSEEEFELCLTQGLGYEEDCVEELIALINGEGWKG